MINIYLNISIEGKMNIRINRPQILKNILETNLQMVVCFSKEAFGRKVKTYEGFLVLFLLEIE